MSKKFGSGMDFRWSDTPQYMNSERQTEQRWGALNRLSKDSVSLGFPNYISPCNRGFMIYGTFRTFKIYSRHDGALTRVTSRWPQWPRWWPERPRSPRSPPGRRHLPGQRGRCPRRRCRKRACIHLSLEAQSFCPALLLAALLLPAPCGLLIVKYDR